MTIEMIPKHLLPKRSHPKYLLSYRKFKHACKYHVDKKCTIDRQEIKRIVVSDVCAANSCPVLRGLETV